MNGTTLSLKPASPLSPLIVGCLAATWFIWGSTYLAIRFALAGFPPFFLVATRFVFAGGVLLLWQVARGSRLPSARQWLNAAVVGTLMLCCGMGATVWAEKTVASGLVVAFIAVIPLLLVVINLAFKIYPSRGELLAVSVGLLGVIMLTRGAGFHASPHGLLAIAFASFSWALGSVLSQRGFSLAPGATGFASEMLCGGVLMLAVSALSGESWQLSNHAGAWLAWWYLVVFGSLIAFNAYMLLLARTPSSLASSYSFVNPIVGLVLGVTLGSETVTSWEWLAAGVVLIGVLLLFVGRRQRVPERRLTPEAQTGSVDS